MFKGISDLVQDIARGYGIHGDCVYAEQSDLPAIEIQQIETDPSFSNGCNVHLPPARSQRIEHHLKEDAADTVISDNNPLPLRKLLCSIHNVVGLTAEG